MSPHHALAPLSSALPSLRALSDPIWLPCPGWPDGFSAVACSKLAGCAWQAVAAFATQLPPELARAVEKRQYEYILGRLAVQELLGKHPQAGAWLPRTPHGPKWPEGIVGSISHSEDSVLVLAGPRRSDSHSVGVDVECLAVAANLSAALSLCFTTEEMGLLASAPFGRAAGFSVKEALFKCLNPLCRRFIDFTDVAIRAFDRANGRMELVLLTDLGPGMRAGGCIEARYAVDEQHVVGLVEWEAAPSCA